MQEIETILKDDCAVGWNNISNGIINQFRHILVPTHDSLSSGILPERLKKAVVLSIYKSGSKDQMTNYRPISLLPCVSKILEKNMKTRLFRYLEAKSILPKRQFGFRPKVSTADAVHHLTHYLAQELDKSNCSWW